MHRIALRTTPARMNGFDSIKWINNYFLWYKALAIASDRHNPSQCGNLICRFDNTACRTTVSTNTQLIE